MFLKSFKESKLHFRIKLEKIIIKHKIKDKNNFANVMGMLEKFKIIIRKSCYNFFLQM